MQFSLRNILLKFCSNELCRLRTIFKYLGVSDLLCATAAGERSLFKCTYIISTFTVLFDIGNLVFFHIKVSHVTLNSAVQSFRLVFGDHRRTIIHMMAPMGSGNSEEKRFIEYILPNFNFMLHHIHVSWLIGRNA